MGCKGAYITRACYPDEISSILYNGSIRKPVSRKNTHYPTEIMVLNALLRKRDVKEKSLNELSLPADFLLKTK